MPHISLRGVLGYPLSSLPQIYDPLSTVTLDVAGAPEVNCLRLDKKKCITHVTKVPVESELETERDAQEILSEGSFWPLGSAWRPG